MSASGHGQVHKVIRVVATSSVSWEAAAQVAVAEGARTISDLRTATLVESDMVVEGGTVLRYRVKLEMAFRLDRSRRGVKAGETVRVRRYLVIASQTLATPALRQLIEDRVAAGPSEFHVLVPEPPLPTMVGDAVSGTIASHDDWARQRLLGLKEAEDRLDDFRRAFADLGSSLTGETGLGDPMTATRRVMERSSFDEIIVSTLPAGASRWLKLDLPNKLQRAFSIPVVSLVQDN